MDNEVIVTRCTDSLETVSLRLGKLNNVIMSICLGMQHESIEQQTIDSMEIISFYIEGIKHIVDDCLEQLEKNQNI